ncbi:protein S100-A7-like [Dryobates pubescens]|uniref:protein S100-A7-like n=1 Tax=Dryobates pubescens TaxID=118200 RepID=UPI0005214936|nr:protein S100-A7-like [Dryobates pubescens]
MSASTRTSSSRAQPQEFPGNCTLEKALKAIVDVYHRYSIREGEVDLLSFSDFQKLLTEQAPTFLQACGRNKSDYLAKLFQETDLNKDKELSFEEFLTVLGKVTDDAHRIMHGDERCTPDRD